MRLGDCMPRVYLIKPEGKFIDYKERVGCADESMINVITYNGVAMKVPKTNIAYIEGE